MQKRNHRPGKKYQFLATVFCLSGLQRMMLTILLLLGTNLNMAAAQSSPEEPASIFAAAKKAIAEGKLGRMPAKDYVQVQKKFVDCPPSGLILAGMELGLGKGGKNAEMIYALRPIYQDEKGNHIFFQEFGAFKDKTLPNSKVVKSKVARIMQLKAKPGYAVGEIHLRVGFGIYALSLTYMRISGQNLDPKQQYSSHWYGDTNIGKEVALGGNGLPLVGVFGHQNEQQIVALGVFYIDQPAITANSSSKPPAESTGAKTSGPLLPGTPTLDPRTGRETTFLVGNTVSQQNEIVPVPQATTNSITEPPDKPEGNKAKEQPPGETVTDSDEGGDFNKLVLVVGLLAISGMSFFVILARRRRKRKPHEPVPGIVQTHQEGNGVITQPVSRRRPEKLPALPKSQPIAGPQFR